MFVFVSLRPGASYGSTESQPAHKEFIAERVAKNEILLGGPFADGVLHGAYVLVVDSLEAAQALAASDPLVTSGVVEATCTEWTVMGINPAAVPPDKVWSA